jgi:hypothetical protein
VYAVDVVGVGDVVVDDVVDVADAVADHSFPARITDPTNSFHQEVHPIQQVVVFVYPIKPFVASDDSVGVETLHIEREGEDPIAYSQVREEVGFELELVVVLVLERGIRRIRGWY